MRRTIINILEAWKIQKNRKVLLLRGARQVGKTYIVRELSKGFKYFVEVNFERDADVRSIFELNLDPERICKNLSIYYGISIINRETLLFFDEIQNCPKAIQSLRFFYEDKPDLHVIAAGSLLEFTLADLPSWGVGRIQSVYMYPLSFDEYLLANNQDRLLEARIEASHENPLIQSLHDRLIEFLKEFLLVGGMPEAVSLFIGNKNDINSVKNVLSNIAVSYYDDFAKYRKRAPVLRLREVMNSVVRQAGNKFIYSNTTEDSNPSQAKEALNLLEMAGLIHKVYHTSGNGIPLGSEVNYKKFKAILNDTGIMQNIAGLRLSEIIIADQTDILNKGSIAEAFVGLELIKYGDISGKEQLFYWHREKRGSSAEVDYLIVKDGKIVPVEVKSGVSGKMQSLNLFMNEKKLMQGIRISLENFSHYNKIDVIPLYAVSNLISG